MTTSLSAGKIWGLRRLADRAGRFKMTAVDQRPPIKTPIKAALGVDEAPWEEVARFKALLVERLQGEASAMLLDPHFAYPRAISLFDPALGLILTLEDSLFTETPEGRMSAAIDDWSVEKIRRIGGDAVKILTWYRPDADESLKRKQQDFTKRIGEDCAKYDIPFVFELLVYPLAKDAEAAGDYVEMRSKNPDLVIDSVRDFADPAFGVDLFKLESPIPAAAVPGVGNAEWEAVQAQFDALGETARRPWVMLSAGAGMAEFEHILSHAYRAGASGYLAGRAIWAEAFKAYPDWAAVDSGLAGKAVDYMKRINSLTDRDATPWTAHPCFGGTPPAPQPADGSFRHHYPGIGG